MPTTLDCHIMKDVFGSARMRAVFDSQRLLQGWLDVWATLAEAQADVGMIPVEAAEAIRAAARAEDFDTAQIGAEIEEGRHILMPSIRRLEAAAGDAGKYVHWGTTTQDVIDTGLLLQCRDALEIIVDDVRDLIDLCIPIAREYRSHAMAGRTHWQHAVPITFGMKIALWVDELQRDLERITRSREELLVAQLFGAGGTMASLGDNAAAVQEAFSRRIGLPQASAPWFNQRDRLASTVSELGMLAATLERINTEIARLSLTEISEVAEPRRSAQVGSSTMPQKHNPINSERAAATCKLVRGLVPVMQGLMVTAHERDMSATTAEWLLIPQCMIMIGGALEMTRRIVGGMLVRPERMTANLALTGGGIVAEAVMFGLADKLGRGEAHELTLAIAREAAERGVPLADVLRESPQVTAILSDEEIDRLVDPNHHLGQAEDVVDGVLARVAVIAA